MPTARDTLHVALTACEEPSVAQTGVVVSMDADNAPRAEQAGELILHRPKSMTAGAARRIHVYRDDERVADLRLGATARVPTDQGPHLLLARCMPLLSANFPIILAANETLHVLVFVDAMQQLEIQLDEDPNPEDPKPQ